MLPRKGTVQRLDSVNANRISTPHVCVTGIVRHHEGLWEKTEKAKMHTRNCELENSIRVLKSGSRQGKCELG